MPDPGLLSAGGKFYLYSTEGAGANVQTATSDDLAHWTVGADALPAVGPWAEPGKTWAPEVAAVSGKYVMFYTASDKASGKQCIGRAESRVPGGPFVDRNTRALICQENLGGSIDPSPLVVDGKVYLYWKNDGNCCGLKVSLWGQPMDPGAANLTGKPIPLLSNTQSWQGNLVEAPEMVPHGGRFYLFYAANDYASTSYAEGYALCSSPIGPCKDSPNPVLRSNAAAAGPGHAFILTVKGKTWILYHAWSPDAVGSEIPGRQLWLDPLSWQNSGPTVPGPNPDPQPMPAVG